MNSEFATKQLGKLNGWFDTGKRL